MPSRPRRILIVHASHNLTDYRASGDGLVAWGFINELAKRGNRLHVLSDKIDVRADVPKNLTLVEFPRTATSKLLHYVSYMRRARAYFSMIEASEGIDVVHQMNPVVRGLSLGLFGKRVPIVLGTYVGDWVRLESSQERRVPIAKRLLRSASLSIIDALQQQFATSIVLATPHAQRRVPLRKFLLPRMRYLHHGVDTDLYSPEEKPGDPAQRGLSILYLGSLYRQKGVLDLVDAFTEIAAEFPTARLVFVGSGDRLDEIKSRLELSGLSDRAEFPGRASRSEVAGWLRSSIVLCAPSYGEPYGQNVLEAMAAGKPVIVTDAGGHRYLGDPRGKLTVTPGDVAGLARALRKILADPELAASMGSLNRSLAVREHAWPRVVDRLEAIYDSVVSGRSGS